MEAPCALPSPDPVRALSEVEAFRGSGLHSLQCLRLTLEDIIAKYQEKSDSEILEEFPFCTKSVTFSNLPLSPPKPRTCADSVSFPQNLDLQLNRLIELYRGQIQWLSSGSRRTFGRVKGSTVAVLIDTSTEHCDGDRPGIDGCIRAVRELMVEQLSQKDMVHLMEFGSKVNPVEPPALPFTASTENCCKVTSDWLLSLEGSGSCNLMRAIEAALDLKEVDTILMVVATRPDQCLEHVLDYVMDRMSSCDGTHRLHLVAFESSDNTADYLERLARGTSGGHYHRFTSATEKDGQTAEVVVEDTEISVFREEIAKAQSLLHNLKSLRSGNITGSLLKALRELSLISEWKPTHLRPSTPPPDPCVKEHSIVCRTEDWLDQFGVTARGLNLYHHLAPNAYPQLEAFVSSVERRVVSEVYDVMPLFPWYDGSSKYLHVDVPRLEEYQSSVEGHIEERLRDRVAWLLSGSRVPFGVVTEQRVVVVLDCSHVLLPHILSLQHHLRIHLGDQLAHTEAFNLVRFGKECCRWSSGMVETTEDSLQDALEWVMGMSPGGSCSLLSALREVLENEGYHEEEECLGIHLVVSALPDQEIDLLISYVEQKLSGSNGLVKLHVTFYNTELCREGEVLLIPGQYGGRYSSEEGIAACLRQLAEAGGGSFHHFRVASSGVEGDDIAAMVEELVESKFYLQSARDIVTNYREFCKRSVPPAVPEEGSTIKTLPPPLYPRQTAASLARLNIITRKFQDRRSMLPWPPRHPERQHLKVHSFYMDQGLLKGTVTDVLEKRPTFQIDKSKPLIPSREEYLTTTKWLEKYGLEKLQLDFTRFKPGGHHRALHKHVSNRGEVVELNISHQGLKDYVKKLEFVLHRYQARLDWLISEDHRCFGTVVEQLVVFVIDGSSSMSAHFQEVRDAMARLLQNKPPTLKSFNLLAYGPSVTKWKESLIPATATNCQNALKWLETLRPEGNSCLLKAIREALQIGAQVASVYLITDGATDHTHEFLLNQLPLLRRSFGESLRINTVAFHCSNEKSHNFLKNLASQTNGRYHCYPSNIDVRRATCSHQPSVETSAPSTGSQTMSTDVGGLVKEYLMAEEYLKETKLFL